MTRILVHAGFHKTGTTSLQTYLAAHRAVLAPCFRFYWKPDFPEAADLARQFGQRPYVWRKRQFARSFRSFLQKVPQDVPIVLSRETFAGAMPGHRDWRGRMIESYAPAGIQLCREISGALRRRFGRQARIEFLFTTRETSAWLPSVHGHLLRSIQMTDDLDAFRAHLRRFDLTSEAERFAKALRPHKVHIVRLEDITGAPEGPASAVLDLMGVPAKTRAQLAPAERRNIGEGAALRAAFLELNQLGLGKAELKARKESLLRTAP